MAAKDYYRILQVSPSATTQEIKKAFRVLALRYHPDKTAGDPLAAAHFNEIQEAYAVLSDKNRRTAWHYEHYPTLSKTARTGIVNAAGILAQCQQLYTRISRQNPFLLDHDLAFRQITDLLSPYHLSVLQHAADRNINSAIVQQLLNCTIVLPFEKTQQVCTTLLQIQPTDAATGVAIHAVLKDRRRQWLIDKYKIPAAILLTLVLLAVIIMSQR